VPNDNDGKRRKITDLDPIEVTLTFAPAIREEFIMAKSANPLNEQELEALAKSLNIEKVEDIPADKLQAAIASKDASGGNLDPRLDKRMPGDPDPDKKPDEDDPTKKPNPFANLDQSVSQALTVAAKALEPHMQSLPEDIQKYFGALPKPDIAPPGSTEPNPMLEAVKSALPEIMKSVTDPMENTIKSLTEQVDALSTEKEMVESRTIAKSISADVEGTAGFLVELKKNGISDENFKKYVEDQRRMYHAASQSDAFRTISKSKGDSVSAYDQVMAKAQDMVAKSENPTNSDVLAKSIQHVLDTNPELAMQYNRDMDRAITPGASPEEA
jgi:hypothetical protein